MSVGNSWRWVVPVLGLGLLILMAQPAAAVSVATDDGMVLTLNSDGSWNSLTVDGNAVAQLTGVTGGFVFQMMDGDRIPYQRNTFLAGTPIAGTATQVDPDTVHIQATQPIPGTGEDLSFDITLAGGQPYIKVDGTVAGPGTDYIFFLYFRIPADASGWTWWSDVYNKAAISTAASDWYFSGYHFHQAEHPDLTDWPYGSITKTTSPAMGLSLSPLFYPPSAYAIQYNGQGGFWIEFELGVTPKTTKHPNTCDFHFVLYKHDPEWGARSAVARYYSFFPQWFQKVSRGGNWMVDYGILPTDPADFALVYFETYLWDTPWTMENNIYTCKYQEPWCWHLHWTVDEIEYYAQDIPENDPYYCPAKGQSIKESAQQAILSTAYDPSGNYVGPGDNNFDDGIWECDGINYHTYRWITNPDVEIPNDRGFNPGRNRGQSVQYWEWYRQWGQEPGPDDHYSGLYHDSATGWWAGFGYVHNFRASHWPYYDYNPGVYMGWIYDDIARGKICMWPPYSNVEFAKLAYEQMVTEDRVVMANSGPDYELFMMAPFLDMIGAGENYNSDVHAQAVVRAIAGTKPSSFLFGAQTEAAIKACMLFDIYPGLGDGSNYENYRALYKKYMPIFDTLDAGGWQAVTNARASNDAMYLERFGPDPTGVVYFVLRAPKRGSTSITVYSQDMGWPPNPDVTITELIYGDPVSKSYDAQGNLVINCGTVSRNDNRAYKLVPNFAPQPPVADFSGEPRSGNPPLTVAFTDLSTGNPTSWDWSFGDGGTSEDQHPSHEYTAVNSYTVSLTAANAQGEDTETKPDYITVANLSCHVGSIELVGKYKGTGPPSGRGYYAEATITVHDQDCATLAGVTVDITWSGCVSGTDSDVTNESGQVVFTSPVNPEGGTFTCTVDNLTKDGYPYNSGANHETSDSIQNP